MGKPIVVADPVLGGSCGYFVDPVNTPEKIFVQFQGVVACPDRAVPPNLHTFTLYQVPLHPCVWQSGATFFGGTCQIQFTGGPPKTNLQLWDSDGRRMFGCADFLYAPEHHIFENENPDCSDSFSARHGTGSIMWMERASEILDDFGFPDDVKILMEWAFTPEGHSVYKFCIPKYHMNLKFKLPL